MGASRLEQKQKKGECYRCKHKHENFDSEFPRAASHVRAWSSGLAAGTADQMLVSASL